MVTKIAKPLNLHKNSQYPQYQQIAATISLPADKVFGATKRVKGIPPSTILTKQTKMRAESDGDVNNGNVPFNQVWVTGNAPAFGAVRINEINQGVSTILSPGQVYDQDIPAGVILGDILSDSKKGIRQNGNEIFNISNLSVNWSIPNTGTIHLRLQNTGGSNIDLSSASYAFHIKVFKSVNEVAEAFYNFGVRKGTTVFSELVENGIPYDKTQQVYQRLFQLMQEREGVVDVNETSIYQDYYSGLFGGSTDKGFIASGETLNTLRSYMQSQSAARGASGYYSASSFNFQHRMVGGYLDGIRLTYKGTTIYNMIYNIEKCFMAMNNRKVAVFGWGALEGVSGYIEARATKQRLRFQNKGGHLIRTVRPTGSFKLVEAQAAFAVLLGNEYIMWNDPGQYGISLSCFDVSHIGGPDPSKDFWQPFNGNIVQYQPGNPTMPQPDCAGDPGVYSDANAPFYNGAFSGVYKVSQIMNRVNLGLRYAPFSYNENGIEKSGYYNGNTPTAGSLGNGQISRWGVSNYGQAVIAEQYFNGQRPIVIEGTGTGGDCLIICHPGAAMYGTKDYNITTQNFGQQNLSHVGNSFEIFLLS
jgi:hypothetical protein